MGIIKTLRNNWKKTVFFSLASVYGGSWAKRKWEDEELRREFCHLANSFGQEVNQDVLIAPLEFTLTSAWINSYFVPPLCLVLDPSSLRSASSRDRLAQSRRRRKYLQEAVREECGASLTFGRARCSHRQNRVRRTGTWSFLFHDSFLKASVKYSFKLSITASLFILSNSCHIPRLRATWTSSRRVPRTR